jgi:hypothetical protein
MNERQRAEHTIKTLHIWIDDLRWYVATDGSPGLNELDERKRESFPYEWDDVVDRIEKVEQAASAGLLESAALAELQRVAAELTELVPTMQRLRLREPDLDALKRAVDRSASAPIS